MPAGELLNALDHAVRRANSALRDMVQANPALDGMGTTLTALLWSGSQLGLLHIGDSRAYLVRDGEVFQITQDHTLVQSLLDEGKITAEEVASHPQRLLLLRALTGDHSSRPDLQLRQARPGDRYLLCSDGLHVVVPADAITRVLLTVADPDQAAARPDRPGHGRRRSDRRDQHHPAHRGRHSQTAECVVLIVQVTAAAASLGPGDIDAQTERIGTCRHFSISGPRTGWRPARATATR